MSWRELRDDIDLGDYYCLYAEALDADELHTYHEYLLAGGEKKKWKWSSPDKAGTTAHRKNALSQLAGLINNPKLGGGLRGSAYEYAKATGDPIIYMDMVNRTYFDESMKPIEYDPYNDTIGYVVIPLENKQDG